MVREGFGEGGGLVEGGALFLELGGALDRLLGGLDFVGQGRDLGLGGGGVALAGLAD